MTVVSSPQPQNVSPTTTLGAAVAALSWIPGQVWWRASWRGVAWLAVSVAVPIPILLLWYGTLGRHGIYGAAGILSIAGEVSILVGTLFFARPLRDATFGWGAALGWTRPTWKDARSGALWALANLGARFLLSAVLVGLVPEHVLRAGNNTANLHHIGALGLTLFGIGAVLVAPVAEETLFRGVLLRAGMRRWTFARSALLSSVIFGAFHSYEAASVPGAAVLVVSTTAFGFVQCLAARRTGRLGPCAVAHALMNGLALVLVITT
ncbi:hypothetical protein acdb102_25960 [Acidothermaceae bacterium B102]|nr:hypothetical protein acdb102_25960 [Acidothermaceae bacterium B102]